MNDQSNGLRRFFAWLASKFSQPPASAPRRIYVRRLHGSNRPVRNGAEIEALARAYGFEVVDPQAHPLADQIGFFRGADTVLSAWGSTLTLSPLLGGARRVIELLPDSITDAWFFWQTAAHGLDYRPLVQRAEADGGFAADLATLERALARLDRHG